MLLRGGWAPGVDATVHLRGVLLGLDDDLRVDNNVCQTTNQYLLIFFIEFVLCICYVSSGVRIWRGNWGAHFE